jgi:hypothetical protein
VAPAILERFRAIDRTLIWINATALIQSIID